jgi:hypothetical protein
MTAYNAVQYSSPLRQTLAPNADTIFPAAAFGGNGMIFHEAQTGDFNLASPRALGLASYGRRCCCNRGMPIATYAVEVNGNLAISEGGAVEPISLAIIVNNSPAPTGIITITPAAVGDLWSFGRSLIVPVPAICGCSTVSLRNISTQAVDLVNANIQIRPPRLG